MSFEQMLILLGGGALIFGAIAYLYTRGKEPPRRSPPFLVKRP